MAEIAKEHSSETSDARLCNNNPLRPFGDSEYYNDNEGYKIATRISDKNECIWTTQQHQTDADVSGCNIDRKGRARICIS